MSYASNALPCCTGVFPLLFMQWLARQTPNHKIMGSSPVKVLWNLQYSYIHTKHSNYAIFKRESVRYERTQTQVRPRIWLLGFHSHTRREPNHGCGLAKSPGLDYRQEHIPEDQQRVRQRYKQKHPGDREDKGNLLTV